MADVTTPAFQDLITDWSPEESSRRLQQGKVSGRVSVRGRGQLSASHLFSGGASGEVSISPGQTGAPGLSHQHPRRERHHSRNFLLDLTNEPRFLTR